MTKRKGIFQKLAIVSAIISFAFALISGVFLYLRLESVGSDNPISASLMASMFFFVSVGAVLMVIGNADLPSFKINKPEEK